MVRGMNGAVGEDSILGDLVSCEESGDSPAALDSDPMVNREQTGAHMPLKRSSLFPLGVAVQACKGIPTQERTIDL